jgi:hypothetical protein
MSAHYAVVFVECGGAPPPLSIGYADDPRRIEAPCWEKVDTYAKLFVSPFHVL